MTIKNAIKILDGYTKEKTKRMQGLRDPSKSWNVGSDVSKKKIASMIADSFETDIIVLKAIKKQIKPKCTHPKELHDRIEGNLYCMGCNLVL